MQGKLTVLIKIGSDSLEVPGLPAPFSQGLWNMGGSSLPPSRWPDGKARGSPGSIAHPSRALQQLLQRKERQDRVVTAVTSTLPCSIHRDFSSFLPRSEILIRGPKQEYPAPFPKRSSSESSLFYNAGCSSYSYKGALWFCHTVLLVIPCSSEHHREIISWESIWPTVHSPNSDLGVSVLGWALEPKQGVTLVGIAGIIEHLVRIPPSPQAWYVGA